MSGQTIRLQGQERRAFWRTPVIWSGSLLIHGRRADCVVLDVSANGAKLRLLGGTVLTGPIVMLEVPRLGAFSANVAWSGENRVGLCFREGLASAALRLSAVLPDDRVLH